MGLNRVIEPLHGCSRAIGDVYKRQVFHELIGSGVVPVTVLDEIFRQAQDSLIAHNARFINEGKTTLYYGCLLYTSGNNDSGKIQYVCLTANSRHSRSMGRCPVKQKSQQQPAFMAQEYY